MGITGNLHVAKIMTKITVDTPKGSRQIKVNNTKGMKANDVILVGMYNTSDDCNLTKELLFPLDTFPDFMKIVNSSGPDRIASYQFIIEIAEVTDEKTIQLTRPVRRDILMKYEPVVAEAPMLREIGMENLRFESAWDGVFIEHDFKNSGERKAKIMDYGWNAINYARVAHGWIRDITIDGSINPIYLQDSRNVTVTDITLEGDDGHAGIKLYAHSNDNLIKNIVYHCHYNHLVSAEGNCYGNVFSNIDYKGEGKANIDAHGIADKAFSQVGWNLFENFTGLHNIQGSGALFSMPNSGTHNTYWNIEAKGFDKTTEIIKAYYFNGRTDSYKMYPGSIIVGFHSADTTLTIDTSPEDRSTDWIYVESLNQPVKPLSLYKAQFDLRMKN